MALTPTLPAEDPVVPPAIKSMIDAAMRSGSESDVAVIVKYAKSTDPASADLVVKIAADWRRGRLAKARERFHEAAFFDLLKGRVELGGYINRGNTNNIGVTGALELRREGLEWRHKFRAKVDYQESLGRVTQDRYLTSYELNWKFVDRAYLYGSALYERDRFSGFSDRVSVSSGAGYNVLKTSAAKLDLELGPAFRHTRFVSATVESKLAARGSLDFSWKLNRGLTVTQNASVYLQDANSTVASKSALLARLVGPLSAQLSYALQYESMPRAGRKSTNTIGRAALVVDF